MRSLFARFCVLSFIVAIAAPLSFAGYGRGGGGGGGSSGGSSAPRPTPPPPPPPIDRSASTKARQDLSAANTEAARTTAALATVTAQLRKQKLEPTDAWKAAHDEQTAAQAKYDAARAAALTAMKSDSAYKTALADRTKALQDRANMDQTTPFEERARIAKAVLATADAVNTLENATVSNDPAATKAKAQLDAANAKLAQIVAAFDATLASDSTWTAASKASEESQQKVADAKKTLADAVAREAQAERDRQKSTAANR